MMDSGENLFSELDLFVIALEYTQISDFLSWTIFPKNLISYNLRHGASYQASC